MAARPGTTTRRSHPRCHRESRRGYDGQHDGRPGDLIATGVDAARQPECEHDRSQERSGADTPRDCVSRLHWSPGRSPGLCDAEHRRPDDDVGNQQTFHNQSGPISEFPSPESRIPDPVRLLRQISQQLACAVAVFLAHEEFRRTDHVAEPYGQPSPSEEILQALAPNQVIDSLRLEQRLRNDDVPLVSAPKHRNELDVWIRGDGRVVRHVQVIVADRRGPTPRRLVLPDKQLQCRVRR
jgi:hypothetical protein